MAEWIVRLDFKILYAVQDSIRCAFLDTICAVISVVFEAGIFWFIAAALLMIPRRTRTASAALLVSMLITFFVGELLMKNIFMRPRPCVVDPSVPLAIKLPGSFSFPSGHTGSSFASAGAILFFSKKLGIPAMIIALVVGLSRIYLFVHYPSDVLAGALLGLAVAYITYLFFKACNVENKIQNINFRKSR